MWYDLHIELSSSLAYCSFCAFLLCYPYFDPAIALPRSTLSMIMMLHLTFHFYRCLWAKFCSKTMKTQDPSWRSLSLISSPRSLLAHPASIKWRQRWNQDSQCRSRYWFRLQDIERFICWWLILDRRPILQSCFLRCHPFQRLCESASIHNQVAYPRYF